MNGLFAELFLDEDVVATRRRPHAIAARLVAILNSTSADELRNRVLYI